MERSLHLTSIGNARELGGLPAHGTTVRKGLLLRTAALVSASEDDLKRLTDVYHVAVVIDLRMTVEKAQIPDPILPGATSLFLPILELEDTPGFEPELMEEFASLMTDRMALLRQSVETGMLGPDLYRGFLLSERGRKGYRRFFQALLELPEGKAALWHCADGKDRTGVAAMLLLSALGASRQTIMEDYLLTNDYNAATLARASAALDRTPMDPQTKRLMTFGMGAVYEEYLEAAFDALDETYGSVEAYLAQELGVGAAERETLRDKFLD